MGRNCNPDRIRNSSTYESGIWKGNETYKAMVELEIKKQYGKFRLDVAFKSEKKRIGILGASGCGKSLTLKSIAGKRADRD